MKKMRKSAGGARPTKPVSEEEEPVSDSDQRGHVGEGPSLDAFRIQAAPNHSYSGSPMARLPHLRHEGLVLLHYLHRLQLHHQQGVQKAASPSGVRTDGLFAAADRDLRGTPLGTRPLIGPRRCCRACLSRTMAGRNCHLPRAWPA